MTSLANMVASSYNRNTYNMTRNGGILQQDQIFIESGFERMVQNSVSYVDDMKNYVPKILELGCGCGITYTRELAGLGKVVGCDVSANQIGCARMNVPTARFIQKDVMELHLKHKYDMVCMFHAFFNICIKDKPVLLNRMKYWLKPYGVIVMTTYGDVTEVRSKDDFYGAPMIWYHTSVADFEKMVSQAGLCVVDHEWREDTIGSKETHLWTLEIS